jgi:hypothetical protein
VSCVAKWVAPRLGNGPRAASILRTPPGSEGSKGQHALTGARGPLIHRGGRRAGDVSQHESGEGVDVARQELDQLRERMAAVKEQAATELDKNWTLPVRTQDLFEIKVKQRLANNEEYQALQARIREAETALGFDSDARDG